ncbi:MAG: tRNA 4-thiouridine(8) synthase ThiI [Candidatus Nealsonbacteria bacterium]
MKKTPRALVLLSGGLDSMLAAKALKNQGIKVTGLSFESYFFNAGAASKAAKNLQIPLRVVNFSKEHLIMLKRPKYGYGKAMNPCIDCHILMLKKAKEIMKKEKFDFVATGEVLGERPMSQTSRALKLIEKEAFLSGFLLRPLSAKLLEKTICEEKGFVKRDRLFNISGRGRKQQIELAKTWGIKKYPSPSGGCLLTDPIFGKKLKELLQICPKCGEKDVALLRYGRHFWFKKMKIVVGRNEEENKKIKMLAGQGDVLVEMKKYPGPQTIIKNYSNKEISSDVLKKAEELTRHYSVKARSLTKNVEFIIITKNL